MHHKTIAGTGSLRSLLCFVIIALLLASFAGCAPQNPSAASTSEIAPETFAYIDALQREVQLPLQPKRVAALLGSFAELWELAGGILVGTTTDAWEENRIKDSPDPQLLGANHEPNLELLLALEPDLVLLSADLSGHRDLDEALSNSGIAHCYLKVDLFEDYLVALKLCSTLTGRDDLYEQNGATVQREILALQEKIEVSEQAPPSVLLMRAMSTAVKARGDDIMAGAMLKELGADNLVDRYPSLLNDLSMETILLDDPDYIFVLTMGDTDKALATLQRQLEDSPAWQELSAVQNDRYIVLPKELFHYKPNARWGEAYAYLARLFYPGLFPAE